VPRVRLDVLNEFVLIGTFLLSFGLRGSGDRDDTSTVGVCTGSSDTYEEIAWCYL
jgi:hypothetical protein